MTDQPPCGDFGQTLTTPVPDPLPLEPMPLILKSMNIRLPTREEIHWAFAQGEEAMVELFLGVSPPVEALAGPLETPAAVLKEWPARLEKNRRNRGKPPSGDGDGQPERPASLRMPGQPPHGGQPGPEGQTLNRSEPPDRTEIHAVETGPPGGSSLGVVDATVPEERRVFDLPAIRMEGTAPRAELNIGPGGGAENRGAFPKTVTGAVPYGNGVKTWAAYVQSPQVVPVERTAPIFEDLLNHRMTEGTLINAGPAWSVGVEPATAAVKAPWRHAAVWPTDESGWRAPGQRQGLPGVSTDGLTDDTVPAQRGQTAMDDAGILPDFRGRALQDHRKPHVGDADGTHALGNAPHLREWQWIEQQ